MRSIAEGFAMKATEPLKEIDVPEKLRRMIDHHRNTLVDLATSLFESGQSEPEVQRTLERVFASFQTDLSAAILNLKETDNAL